MKKRFAIEGVIAVVRLEVLGLRRRRFVRVLIIVDEEGGFIIKA